MALSLKSKVVSVRPTSSRRVMVVRASADVKSKLLQAIENAKKLTEEAKEASLLAKAAWNEVESLSNQGGMKIELPQYADPLEKFCEANPDSDECRVFED